ncbi:MAG: sodium-dependent transporter [Gemmatimonadetes bacterium]|nr:sodium-dependent transporter [Gemmatimonadota bacterium]
MSVAPEPGIKRELFGSRMGFVLAAVGSAVGLGNMWRFPYQAAEGGGAAFVAAYVLMVFVIGVPMMLAEFAAGRSARRSALGAVRRIGGARWIPLGLLFVATSTIILSYLSVITGWAIQYATDAMFVGYAADAGARYAEVASGGPAIALHLLSVAITVGIVVFGVRRGIEKASLVLMPTLFLLLIGLAVWASTLPGAGRGYAFYLTPSLSDVLDPAVLQGATAQAFYSLSVGMGIMITYSSYLPKETNLNREASIIALSDFSVAFIAGLVVFPIVFALGLSEQIGDSTMGALFISLPSAFSEMGAVGRWVGSAFFLALLVAAITSAVSLLEVSAAVLIDQLGLTRKVATVVSGVGVAALGVIPALSLDALAIMDQLAAELFTVVGVLGVAVLVGWFMKNPEDELRIGASPVFERSIRAARFLVRYVAPPLLAWISWVALRQTITLLTG